MLASKKKGMWMNGTGPLGYTNKDRTLEIDEENAKTIRLIFEKYLELKSVHLLKNHLEENSIKTRTDKAFSKGHLYKILSNKTYIGKITHKDNVYEGLHKSIIDYAVFDKVQKLLADNRINQKNSDIIKNPSLLARKLYDDKNNYMSPSHSNTRNRKYRYYVSQAIIQHRRNEAGSISKIPAEEIEKIVTKEINAFVLDSNNIQPLIQDCNIHKQKELLALIEPKIDSRFIRTLLSKVIIYKHKVEIIICKNQLLKTLEAIYNNTDLPEEIKHETKTPIVLTKDIKITATSNNGSVLILTDSDTQQPEINPILVKVIAKSYWWNKQILSGEAKNGIEIQKRENLKSYAYVANILDLRFLAPSIVESVLNGTQSRNLTIKDLFKIKTLNWVRQRKELLNIS